MFSTLGYYICIPFAWLVRVFYNLTGSYGIAIILFTLVIKLLMLPFQMKSKKSMMRMSRMSGRMQEIQKKYANNQTKMGEEMQKLYAEEGVNPMSGCLWSFLPLPILIALYSIIRQPVTHFMMLSEQAMYGIINHLADAGASVSTIVKVAEDGAMELGKTGLPQLLPYGQINLVKEITSQMPEYGASVDGWMNLNYNFLGLDLTANPSTGFGNFAFSWAVIGLILIPILAGLSQLVLSMITMKQQPQQEGPAARSTKSMMYMMPLMSVYIAFVMPAALGIYWIAQSVFSLIQEVVLGKIFNKKLEEEENARYEARQSDRQRRMEEGKALQEQRKQQAEQKQSLKEKRKAAQEAKAQKAKKSGGSTTEAGRVGDRPYARGRAYKADRYDEKD
ncbi:membrane protein insertase YidC [Oscillibacter sp.]|uniref:membrane protein insertase YidC n=1 Tax=Oscillibacter sp. TaxID=1945593 RepID=UPI00263A11C9|nr:membrane protein insertase YidC [Oscillibacter sp.]MDD3346073.1 membrane protein insertase YidC [Oscillibacter sp.]